LGAIIFTIRNWSKLYKEGIHLFFGVVNSENSEILKCHFSGAIRVIGI
jgi:hypothetical protein